jgi:hypothetical protein
MSRVEMEYMDIVRKLKTSAAKLVDKSVWDYRLSICIRCEKYEQYSNKGPAFKCHACGCPGFRFMLQDSKCPLKKPKWR